MVEQLRTVHSYICIVAFHLGTINVPCEGRDVGVEPEDGDGGRIQKMDGWIPMCTTEGRCSPSSCSLTNTDLVLFSGKPRSMSYYYKLMQLIIVSIYFCI